MSTTTHQHTVMVIEDEEAFIDALVVGLQREGFGVEVARDGAEALLNFDKVDP
ncbi:MAG: response regulator, partial [Acidimicrobiia bacterium]|nr:response regulator [Acidimicrobiia bacterium]